LVTFYVLFFLDLASRTVKIAGATTNPGDAQWPSAAARERQSRRHLEFAQTTPRSQMRAGSTIAA
jgi:hypothetical protein